VFTSTMMRTQFLSLLGFLGLSIRDWDQLGDAGPGMLVKTGTEAVGAFWPVPNNRNSISEHAAMMSKGQPGIRVILRKEEVMRGFAGKVQAASAKSLNKAEVWAEVTEEGRLGPNSLVEYVQRELDYPEPTAPPPSPPPEVLKKLGLEGVELKHLGGSPAPQMQVKPAITEVKVK